MIDYEIIPLKNYPDNGKHQRCVTELPFDITKGEDRFCYEDKDGKRHHYNSGEETDERWIVFVSASQSNISLKKIFKIKVNKDLNVILDYCVKIYKKSLEMELVRINEILNTL